MRRLRLLIAGAVCLACAALAAASTAGPSASNPPGKTATDNFGTRFHRIAVDDFTIKAKRGSWGTTSPTKVVYRGDHGVRWTEYPDGWGSRRWTDSYRPAKVLSVHNGVLDYWLHACRYPDGTVTACGANPSPILGKSQYIRYGRFEARIRLSRPVAGYRIAWLLWPKPSHAVNDYAPCAESDFPEMELNLPYFHAFAHNCGCPKTQTKKCQDYYNTGRINVTKWHTVTQEWGPGWRRYYIDGRFIGQSTSDVYSKRERWQLQVEGQDGTASAHLLVDWVWVGKL